MSFIPMTKEEINGTVDFVLVSGDAYIDHPSFGVSIIGQTLINKGFKVGIIAQPDWNNIESFKVFDKPTLGFLVTAGNIDSMVNHYTVAKKRREKDYYTPGGVAGKRPDRATIVYSNKIRECYKDSVIILGGIEASLRRLSHYDYWDNKVRRSILQDSSADILVYGMAENSIVEVAEALKNNSSNINDIRGIVYKTRDISNLNNFIVLPSYEEVCKDKDSYSNSFLEQYNNTNCYTAKTLVESYGNVFVVQNPPAYPLTTSEFDRAYSLDYMRTYHPSYEKEVPAIEEVKFSIISNRGCFGACNFCALTFHQGRIVQSRSHNSIIFEAEKIIWDKDFKGYIHDVGGPTANFRFPACEKQKKYGPCDDKQCLFPKNCENLSVDHKDYLKLLKKLRELPKVKKVFVRSGIRFDYVMYDKNNEFLKELIKNHVSGQLKIAPEHISDKVLKLMGKPSKEVYENFRKTYYSINEQLGLKQFLVPYLMSSHPGSDLDSAIELAQHLKTFAYMPEQVQDFYPTPGTLSTCMYYTEKDPRTGQKVYVPKTLKEKAMQRALLQYRLPQNRKLVIEALKKAGREDLIGFESYCLVRPDNFSYEKHKKKKNIKVTEKEIKKKTIRNVHKKKK